MKREASTTPSANRNHFKDGILLQQSTFWSPKWNIIKCFSKVQNILFLNGFHNDNLNFKENVYSYNFPMWRLFSLHKSCNISHKPLYFIEAVSAKQFLYKFLRSPSISYCFRHSKILSSFSIIKSLRIPLQAISQHTLCFIICCYLSDSDSKGLLSTFSRQLLRASGF